MMNATEGFHLDSEGFHLKTEGFYLKTEGFCLILIDRKTLIIK